MSDERRLSKMMVSAPNGDLHIMPCACHDVSRHCWCEPSLKWPCLECALDDVNPNCWQCGGKAYVTTPNGLPALVCHDLDEHRPQDLRLV